MLLGPRNLSIQKVPDHGTDLVDVGLQRKMSGNELTRGLDDERGHTQARMI